MDGTTWQLSGYTHVRDLGAGASGQVVLATHDATGTPVAIKYLVPKLGAAAAFTEAFRVEAELLAEIDDPYVARLYEYVESPLGAAIVMELVDGVSLRQMLRAHGPTEPESALCVLKGSLLGLAAAHDRDVVHRDYKPENVLVTAEGGSKLADFGIAMPTGAGPGGRVTGTPRYMAPEQWSGALASPAGDIYAATATFFECLTGRPPYESRELVALWHQHAHAPIPTPDAPEAVVELVRRGLAKEPADRPQSARAFVDLLEEAAVRGYGSGWEERGWRQVARRAALLAALFPFADRAGGGTALANTVLGTGAGIGAGAAPGGGIGATGGASEQGPGHRRRWGRTATVAAGVAALLLSGGVGLSYAARDDTPTVLADHAGGPSAVTTLDPPADPAATAAPPAVQTSPVPSATGTGAPAGPTADRPAPGRATPVPSRTPGRRISSSPLPLPSPPPAVDSVAPSAARVVAKPSELVPGTCRSGQTSSTIAVLAADDKTPAADLRVSFRYTLSGQSTTVAMTHTGDNQFHGVLRDLPAPGNTTRIEISVTAVDAAGNRSAAAGPVHVTLSESCPVIIG